MNLVKVSIVMAYINRKEQLMHTIKTIINSMYKNIELIIVNDFSDKDQSIDMIEEQYKDKIQFIKIINIKKEEKTWINPCIPYNIGIKQATGDIIILQNPEVCHVGDCISYVVKNLKKNSWLTLNCYGLGNFDHNNIVYNIYENNYKVYDYIKLLSDNSNSRIGGNSALGDGNVQGWLNHPNFFTAYHYFGAIYKTDLFDKMNGGFDEDYKDGINLDDIDFVKRLIYNKIQIVGNYFHKDVPFTIHLYHTKAPSIVDNPKEKHDINKKIFDKKCKEMNLDNNVDIKNGFFMPFVLI
jgi:glycosyltransferase involved in cell wall biosynthesis